MARTKTRTRSSAPAKKLTNGALTAPRGAEFQPRVRVTINKAYKMYVGGAFVRSESGRYFQVKSAAMVPNADPDVVNVPRGSRKDVRDAVLAAKNAGEGWAARTPYNRGQILYRLAEMMESRREELVTALVRGGVSATKAAAEVDASVDRAVFYAGFSDKFHSLLASSNPVAGPHFNFSVPEPMGVIGVIAPPRPSLLGLVSAALPAITGGNTCVVLASEEDPRTALVFAEALATSDLPGGVLNILTGSPGEVGPVLSKHREVIGLEAWTSDAKLRETLERDGADNVKRIKTHDLRGLDWSTLQGLGYIERFLETKTVWHPVGL
ncbi:MAG TPA: aldehyde dehydrogenase family protein [Polyangiaceae bacterium]